MLRNPTNAGCIASVMPYSRPSCKTHQWFSPNMPISGKYYDLEKNSSIKRRKKAHDLYIMEPPSFYCRLIQPKGYCKNQETYEQPVIQNYDTCMSIHV